MKIASNDKLGCLSHVGNVLEFSEPTYVPMHFLSPIDGFGTLKS